MEKIKINQSKADSLVKDAFEYLGYTDNKQQLELITYLDDHHLTYHIIDTIIYRGEKVKKITRLDKKRYYFLLKEGLKLKGFEEPYINSIIEKDRVSYLVTATMITYDSKPYTKKKGKR